MIQEEGMKGYGIYWTVLEFLRLQNEYKASLTVIPILAQKARVTTATLKRIIYDYAPVSYTHLDVYKRQALYCPCGHGIPSSPPAVAVASHGRV